jgi:selenocysteine lyase/cysteine desulfurase
VDKFERIRKRFPVTRLYTYLNNAAVSPSPQFITGEAARVFEGYGASGGECETDWHHRVSEIRDSVARLVGADTGEIFFTKNTSEALVLAARAFRWKPGDKVVCLRGEFPANVVPFHLLSEQGVGLSLVEPRPDNRFPVEEIASALDSSTRMLAVSFVEFHTGFRNDLAALGKLCRERDIFFVVDGVQGVGALRTEVRKWGVDLLSTGGHKWLLAPEGVGFAYLRAESLELLEPVACSWLSLEQPLDFLARGVKEAGYDKPLRNDAARFEGGTLNVAGIHALGKSVETMLELGVDDIENRILHLGARAVEGLKGKGYEVLSPQQEGERSGITVFRSGKLDMSRLLVDLRSRGFALGFPCGAIRISPHYYNNEDDIDRLISALP